MPKKSFKPASNTEVMLRMIQASGGMRFTDIQKLLWRLANPGGDISQMSRGHYCTYLCGGRFYHRGVLNTFCVKGEDGLWRVTEEIKPPWKRWKRTTSWLRNSFRRRRKCRKKYGRDYHPTCTLAEYKAKEKERK